MTTPLILAHSFLSPLSALVRLLEGKTKVLAVKLLSRMGVKKVLEQHKNKIRWPEARAMMGDGLGRLREAADGPQAALVDELVAEL